MNRFASAEDVVRLGALVLKLGRTNRATFHEDGERPETDTDHTVMLGIIACAIANDGICTTNADGVEIQNVFTKLNPARVAEFVTVHDLVEAHAGDTMSFAITAEGRDEKEARERAAFDRIASEFACFPWIASTIATYEAQNVPEARFVRYLDKAMPKITHILNKCRTLKMRGIDKAKLVAEHDKQMEKLAVEYPEFPGVGDLLHALCRAADACMVET